MLKKDIKEKIIGYETKVMRINGKEIIDENGVPYFQLWVKNVLSQIDESIGDKLI